MRPFIKCCYILLICTLCLVMRCGIPRVHAAENITTAQWQQLTSDKAFGYKNDSEQVQTPVQYKPGAIEKAIYLFFKFWSSKPGQVLLWILIIGVGCYIAYRVFLRGDNFLFGKNKKLMNGTDEAPDGDEKDLATTNWETLLHNAVRNNDYRLAIRYSYMWMLQIMQQQSLIQYRSDKTNYEYYTELNDTAYKQPFKQLSRQYEYAWYGRFPLSQTSYNEYRELFDNVRKQLGA